MNNSGKVLHTANYFAVASFICAVIPSDVCAGSAGPAGDSLYNSARQNAHRGEYKSALSTLDAVLAENSAHVDALLLYGQVYLWSNDVFRALPVLNRVVTIAPSYRDAWIALANAYVRVGNPATACSTCVRGLQQLAGDSLLLKTAQSTCEPELPAMSSQNTHLMRSLETYAAVGGTFFEKSYNRYMWNKMECGIDLKEKRLGFQANLRTQRRKYGEQTLYGSELEIAPRISVLPECALTVRLSASPYGLFDTIFASGSVSAEINTGLPGGIELDGNARFRWYGGARSALYIAGIGKYSGPLLLSGRLFAAPIDKTTYFSGVGELRYYSRTKKISYIAINEAFGRSPYDAGTLTTNGYISFAETTLKVRCVISGKTDCQPELTFAGEQLTRKADIDGNGIIEIQRSIIRKRISLQMTLFLKKDR